MGVYFISCQLSRWESGLVLWHHLPQSTNMLLMHTTDCRGRLVCIWKSLSGWLDRHWKQVMYNARSVTSDICQGRAILLCIVCPQKILGMSITCRSEVLVNKSENWERSVLPDKVLKLYLSFTQVTELPLMNPAVPVSKHHTSKCTKLSFGNIVGCVQCYRWQVHWEMCKVDQRYVWLYQGPPALHHLYAWERCYR